MGGTESHEVRRLHQTEITSTLSPGERKEDKLQNIPGLVMQLVFKKIKKKKERKERKKERKEERKKAPRLKN